MGELFQEKEQEISTNKQKKNATQVLPETFWASEPIPSGIPPENTVVVTISRQFGSGGSDVARQVAKQAGLNYVDNHIIAEVAGRLGVETLPLPRHDEQTTSMVGHILKAVQASTPFTVNYHSSADPISTASTSREYAYFHLTQKVILDLVAQGNTVIVGRGSQFLLSNSPRTLNIYIFAPLTFRIQTVMRQFQLNHSTASRLIEQRDYEQDSYLRRYYGKDGHQPGLYHLLINTGLFSIELAADFICQALPTIKNMP